MVLPPQLFEPCFPDPAYLKRVTAIHHEILGDGLTGLYLHGSAVQGDFQPESSDLDLLAVVDGGVGGAQREELAARLDHHICPVPAFGLELIICAAEAVRTPVEAMPYEFALSTGPEWGTRVETDGTTSDILVHMQLCRQRGLPLFGKAARDTLAHVPMSMLKAGLIGEMIWHRGDLRGDPTDQSIVNAVLNAARSRYAGKSGEIISKTEGGKRWLSLYPEERVVAQALEYRTRQGGTAPDLRAAREFIELAIAAI